MKPVPATITGANSKESIFLIREVIQPYFSPEFHFHEECQLAYIIKGSGKRIIGDSVERFDEGELVFIGSNVPHVWLDERQNEKQCISLSLFISPYGFREHFSAFGDVQRIDALFEKAKLGMLITGETKEQIVALLKTASMQLGIERAITLFNLIYALGSTTEYWSLTSPNYINYLPCKDNDRMNRVYSYLLQNFNKDIQLHQVADIAGMNPNAFCRFFKARTQKSLTTFVNEIRIGHACKLLLKKDESISQIAYNCGFNNVSNFNLFFKLFKNIPPRQFRKELLGLN